MMLRSRNHAGTHGHNIMKSLLEAKLLFLQQFLNINFWLKFFSLIYIYIYIYIYFFLFISCLLSFFILYFYFFISQACFLSYILSSIFIYIYMLVWLGWVLWHFKHCRLFNAKSSLYIYTKYIGFSLGGLNGNVSVLWNDIYRFPRDIRSVC